MQIPEFWAEVRLEGLVERRNRVVRRFGWSEVSQVEADRHAQRRAEAALAELQAGRKVPHRERKLAYGGAGLPIREEVVARNGNDVVTRNSYGARCLNQPDVLFADIDVEHEPSRLGGMPLFVPGAMMLVLSAKFVAMTQLGILSEIGYAFAAVTIVALLLFVRLAGKSGGARRYDQAMNRIRDVVARQPAARYAVYRTPKGFRLLALHRTFDPASEEVKEMFFHLDTDPAYAQMCALQACFRARVSPKPWRIGVARPPSRTLWPVPPELHRRRQEWAARYESLASDYAACQFVEEIGNGPIDPRCADVQRVHDEMCRARTELPMA